jgi:transposase-like protein
MATDFTRDDRGISSDPLRDLSILQALAQPSGDLLPISHSQHPTHDEPSSPTEHQDQLLPPAELKIYTAPNAQAAETAFADFCAEWEERYPAMIRLWRTSWEHFIPFLDYPPELRRIVYTTNAIESLNARFRQATRRRGHFPNEQAALKVLYLVLINPLKNRSNITGKTVGWNQVLNTLAMYYGDRLGLQ